jgi:predicted peptidase
VNKYIFTGIILISFIFISQNFFCRNNNSELLNKKSDKVYSKISAKDTIVIYNEQITVKKAFYKNENDTLLFRIYIPDNYDTVKFFPLFLFLHGAGERGNDNESQMNIINDFIMEESFQNQSSFVIIPQCPNDEKWVDADWTELFSDFKGKPEKSMNNTINLLNKITGVYKIDTNRIYVMGLSMGGFGTWDIITRLPGKFSAAVPICGGGDEKQIGNLKSIPIWAFHGAKDKSVPVSRSRNMVYALRSINADIKYTEYENAGHNAWTYALKENDLINWIFAQTKSSR